VGIRESTEVLIAPSYASPGTSPFCAVADDDILSEAPDQPPERHQPCQEGLGGGHGVFPSTPSPVLLERLL
jgi:hypothetical protein